MQEKRGEIRDLTLTSDIKVTDLVEQFKDIGFNAGNMAKAADCWLRAYRDEARIFLTLAGAMTPAGLRKVIAQAIENNLVHAIITTGANMVHELHQGWIDGSLLKDDGKLNDIELRDCGLLRILDVLVVSKKWKVVTDWVEKEFYSNLVYESENKTIMIQPNEIFRKLGKYMNERGDKGILATAFSKNVPIYCPAFMDSDLGISLQKTNLVLANSKKRILIDQTTEYCTLVEEMRRNKKRGIIIVGGGTPKNFTLQCSLVVRDGGFSYAVQFTTDAPHWGGLSGATLSEAVSWGKIRPSNKNMVTVYSDATITFPLTIAYLLGQIR